jgi:hypothetical protein
MLQDILDLAFLGSIVWATWQPLPNPIMLYMRIQKFGTPVLFLMRLFPRTNNYTAVFAWVYWSYVIFLWLVFLAIVWRARWRTFSHNILRILTASWVLMAIYYAAYFLDPKATRWDWCPDVILGVAFVAIGLQARAESRLCIPSQP